MRPAAEVRDRVPAAETSASAPEDRVREEGVVKESPPIPTTFTFSEEYRESGPRVCRKREQGA